MVHSFRSVYIICFMNHSGQYFYSTNGFSAGNCFTKGYYPDDETVCPACCLHPPFLYMLTDFVEGLNDSYFSLSQRYSKASGPILRKVGVALKMYTFLL